MFRGDEAAGEDDPAAKAGRFPEALDSLIQLYTKINKPDEVKKWQVERAQYQGPNTKPMEKK